MTWLAGELRERVQIRTPVQIPNAVSGGFDRSYITILTIWAGFKPITSSLYIRGKQIKTTDTHEFKIRLSAISSFGSSFSKGFSNGFASMSDLMILKTNYFIFVQRETTTKGRLFRIGGIENVGERREYLKVRAEEIEETGSGSNP